MQHYSFKSHREIDLQTNLEYKINLFLSPIASFVYNQTAPAVLLMISSLLSIIIINLPTVNLIDELAAIRIGLHSDNLDYTMPLKEWINCGLMTLFFFFVGLEVKREFLSGKLNDKKELVLVILASTGGMIVPSVIYLFFNYIDPIARKGWIIPMATDTAFAIGLLTVFARLLSVNTMIFFTTMVVFDDIGSMLFSAFIVDDIYYIPLLKSILVFLLIFTVNKAGIRSGWLFFIISLLAWHYFHESGLHTSMAGIIIAFLMPVKPYISDKTFITLVNDILQKLHDNKSHHDQCNFAFEINTAVSEYFSPLQQWESKLTGVICLIVLPLFAVFNSGVHLSMHSITQALSSNITWGIIFGLLIGKPLGIIGFAMLTKKLKIGSLPDDVAISELVGISILAGIGFTMSMYHVDFIFLDRPDIISFAKFGILTASVLSAIAATVYFNYFK